jgi:hypothetical protein
VTAVEVRPTSVTGGLAEPDHLGLVPADGSGRAHAAATLVRMANQIAAHNESEGLAASADAVALHLGKFWTPTMLADLVEVASSGEAGIAPAVHAALERLPIDA